MGLRTASSALSSSSESRRISKEINSNVAKAALAMAPAITEPISHRQSKLSSPAQASSPLPLISDVTEQTQTTTSTNQSHHHNLVASNGDGDTADNYLVVTKDIINTNGILLSQQLTDQKQQHFQQQQHLQESEEDFESIFVQQTIASNGPCLGPLFDTHMDQNIQNIDQTAVSTDFQQQPLEQQQQQQSQLNDATNLLNAIVDNSDIVDNTVDSIINDNTFGQHVNQIDCTNLNAFQATAEELMAQQQTQFHQQFGQQFLNQSSHDTDQSQLDQLRFDDLQQQALQNDPHQNHQQYSHQQNQSSISNEQAMHQQVLQQQSQPPMDLLALPSENTMQQSQQSQRTEIDQILGDLSSTDIDLMQVLKCFESTPAGENLGDLAGGLSLFNDVDVMNIGLDDVVAHSSPSKENNIQDTLTEIEKKREKMIRECDFMMRRLRKIQARHMARHISEEIGGVFEYAQQMIKRKERETKSISTMTPINQMHSDKQKMNSAASLKLLLKRIEHAAINQQASSSNSRIFSGNTSSPNSGDQHLNNSSPTGSNALSSKPSIATCVPAFELNGTHQIKQCAGLLGTELKIVDDGFDSDATISSSGGESADEGVLYNNATQATLSM